MDNTLTTLTAQAIIKSLDQDSLQHLISHIGKMYKLLCYHQIWDGKNHTIKEKGILGIYMTVEEAEKAKQAHIKFISDKWCGTNDKAVRKIINIDRGICLTVDEQIQDRYIAPEYYIYDIQIVLEGPFIVS